MEANEYAEVVAAIVSATLVAVAGGAVAQDYVAAICNDAPLALCSKDEIELMIFSTFAPNVKARGLYRDVMAAL